MPTDVEREKRRKYYSKTKEARCAYQRAWHEAHKDEANAYARDYYWQVRKAQRQQQRKEEMSKPYDPKANKEPKPTPARKPRTARPKKPTTPTALPEGQTQSSTEPQAVAHLLPGREVVWS